MKRYNFTRTHYGEPLIGSDANVAPDPFAGDWHRRADAGGGDGGGEVIRFVKISEGYQVQWINSDNEITDSANASMDPASAACVANICNGAGYHVCTAHFTPTSNRALDILLEFRGFLEGEVERFQADRVVLQ